MDYSFFGSPAGIHFTASLILSIIYGVAAITAVKTLSQKGTLDLFGLALCLALGFVSVSFSLYAFFAPPWHNFHYELVAFFLAIFPVLVFSVGLFKYFRQGGVNSKARFNRLKEEFLSVASHELRTPLSVINGFAEILVREKIGPLNDEQKRRVRKILMQGQRLNRIVDELLDLSRIRSGKVVVRRDVFDLVPVLKACLDDHQVVCEQQKLTLIDHIPDVLSDVIGDVERVMQVVVNLLNNAIKYTPSDGIITVTAQHTNEHIRVEIRDNGIGIAANEQTRVFEEFYRSADQAARRFSGSGLGLAIVKQLVEVQGGEVGVSSEGLGKGTCFYFTLPAAKKSRKDDPRAPKHNLSSISADLMRRHSPA